MKKTRITLARDQRAKDTDAPPEVDGWRLEHVPGLVAHKVQRRVTGDDGELEWRSASEWYVTHEASGLRIDGRGWHDGGFRRRTDAFDFIELAALLADWTLPAAELKEQRGLADRVKALRSALRAQ